MVTGGTGAKMRVCSKVNSKINSLQGLRFVACICVFGAHTAIKELTPFLGGGERCYVLPGAFRFSGVL